MFVSFCAVLLCSSHILVHILSLALLPSLSFPFSLFLSIISPALRLPTLLFPSSHSRLHSNSLRCDCHLAWLSPWLRQRPALGLYTQCSSPPALRGLNLAELRKSDFTCSGTAAWWYDTRWSICGWWTGSWSSFSCLSLGHSGSAFVQPCSLASGSCPPMCSCSNNIVDCRGRGLTAIPAHLPEAMTEMWVSKEKSSTTRICPRFIPEVLWVSCTCNWCNILEIGYFFISGHNVCFCAQILLYHHFTLK